MLQVPHILTGNHDTHYVDVMANILMHFMVTSRAILTNFIFSSSI